MRNEQQRQASDNSRVGVRHDTMFPPLLRSGCSDPVAKSGDSPSNHQGTKERAAMRLKPFGLAIVLTTAATSVRAGDLYVVGNLNLASNMTVTSMSSADQYFKWDAGGGLQIAIPASGNRDKAMNVFCQRPYSGNDLIAAYDASTNALWLLSTLPDRSFRIYSGESDLNVLKVKPSAVEMFTTWNGFPADGQLNVYGSASFSGNVEIDGPLKLYGGMDPPYLLLDSETRDNIAQRVAREVPPSKQTGAALFWNSQTRQLEIYVGSEGTFYSLAGKVTAAIVPPVVKGATVKRRFQIDGATGAVVEEQTMMVPRWQLKPGYEFNSQSGAFTYLSSSNAAPVTVTAQEALELK
jgi:hypothetical protein